MKVKDTWEEHYNSGGNSGRGSYNEHFTFKTNVITNIINKYEIKSVTDFGCGDGNQILKLISLAFLNQKKLYLELLKVNFKRMTL